MITKKEKFTIESDSLSSAKFSLKDENLAHVFNILRNNLYSDKILAVIREISTNAYDANVENKLGSKPIQVTLPNIYNPVLKIRDFGKGLSEHDVFNIFSSYGASTKRNSNAYVGTLGMGSKSPFAYAPSFTVISYHGGYKRVYEAFIDETEIGTIAKIMEEKSNEPTGLEVVVAVKQADIQQFIATSKKFYMWFNPMPEFHGHDLGKEIYEEKNGLLTLYDTKYGVLLRSKRDYVNIGSSVSKLFVRMGNICYPVLDFNGLNADWLTYNFKLIINVKIGEVTFTTSRESLEMKEQTINTINRYLDIIRKDIIKEWQLDMDSKATGWEALCHFKSLDFFQKTLLCKGQGFNWKGHLLNQNLAVYGSFTQYNPSNKKWVGVNSGDCFNNSTWFIINDGGFPSSQHRSRLMEAYNNLKDKGNVVYFKSTVSEAEKLLISKEFEGANYVLLSSVSPTVTKNSKKVFKDNQKIFKWNGTKNFPYSTNWSPVDKLPTKMVYVFIENFVPSGFGWFDLINLLNTFKSLGHNFELYGVKPKGKLPNEAIHLSDYVTEFAVELAKSKEYKDVYYSEHMFSEIKHHVVGGNIVKGLFDTLKDKVVCPDFQSMLKINYNTNTSAKWRDWDFIIKASAWSSFEKNETLRNILSVYNQKIKDDYAKFLENAKQCQQKYPLVVDLCDRRGYYNITASEAEHLVDYVNAMYRSRQSATVFNKNFQISNS